MIGLTDEEFFYLGRTIENQGLPPADPRRTEIHSDQFHLFDNLVQRGLLGERMEQHWLGYYPTPLGKIVFNVERAIRSGVDQSLFTRGSA